jgi:hypothetical protein
MKHGFMIHEDLSPMAVSATVAEAKKFRRRCIPHTNHTGRPCVNVNPSAHVVP